MKKFLFLFIFSFLNFSFLFADENTHFIDIDFLLNNSNSGKIIIEDLKKINSKITSELETQENELKLMESDISKVKNIISEKELQNKIKILKKEITLYRKDKNKKTQEFNALKDKKIKDFFIIITPIVESFMKKNSIGIIVDKKNIFIANSKYDITKEIIKIINENN